MAACEKTAIEHGLKKYFPTESDERIRSRREDLIEWCIRQNVQILFPDQFPPFLSQISDPPSWLFVRGNPSVLLENCLLGFVGTRSPSAYGLRAAHFLSREIVERGFIVVSGLARGIDSVAHRTSVLLKRPTIAVLGHGLDRVYPSQNSSLACEIVAEGGCLLSEYPPGIPPYPHHFPARNRILSALCVGVVVVEAGEKSGSLITARHALEQNREVYVVPGPIFEPGFRGSHWLVQQGAKLVSKVEDVTEELRPGLLPLGPGAFDKPAALNLLKKVFREQGVVSLEGLVSTFGKDWNSFQPLLEQALREGLLVEHLPQRFVLAGI